MPLCGRKPRDPYELQHSSKSKRARRAKVYKSRAVPFNDPEYPKLERPKFKGNDVHTTKYHWYNFLPKNLFEQFRRVANFYFLIIAILQMVPGLSPVSPITSILPLVIVVAFTAIKEGIEDFRRYMSDRAINRRTARVVENGTIVERQWRHITAGMVLRVDKDEFLPADLVLLHASNPGGLAYIETANLDGETNLKIKQAAPATNTVLTTPEAMQACRAKVECEGPNPNVHNFEGRFVEEGGQTHSLGKDQCVLRGCQLRNTAFMFGLVIYTGHETKLFLNAGLVPSKRSTVERILNYCILFMFLFQLAVCVISAIAGGIWNALYARQHWYLEWSDLNAPLQGFLNYFTFIILYNVMIPISLYVSMEIVKVLQARLMEQDLDLYYPDNDTPAKARTSNLNEELGQVEYVFSDKTGTLTRNIMEFMKCSVNGFVYGTGVTEIESAVARRQGRTLTPTEAARPGYNFDDPRLHKDLADAQHPNSEAIRDFLTCLAVNHAIIPEDDPTDTRFGMKYQASSPDELALAVAARELGFEFFKRTVKTVSIRVGPEEVLEYEILANLEFSSDRKRSSVIAREPSGRIVMYSKGADDVMFTRLAETEQRRMVTTNEHKQMSIVQATRFQLGTFASQGLRTLVIGKRYISDEEFASWHEVYHAATCAITERASKVDAACETIEKGLTIVGATAIEDKLQRGVPYAIELMRAASIKVWMLTGDKRETAINIGYACSLLDNEFKRITISASDRPTCRALFEEAMQEHEHMTFESDTLGLVIDGFTLHMVMDLDEETKDRADGLRPLAWMLLQLASKCRAVICCRMGPSQKAQIAELVRLNAPGKPVTLAIGDGANDVPMIQTTHVGIGISGEEGLQAVRAADYAIAQFRFLAPLLLVHGRWNYKRIAKLIVYSFYKNITFTLTLFWYNIFTGFSGQTLYNSWYISLYNVVFTALPIIFFAVVDQDVGRSMSITNPRLYRAGQKHELFNQKVYWAWIVRGVFHSAICFFVSYLAFDGLGMDQYPSGRDTPIWTMGLTSFFSVICVVTVSVYLLHNTWTLLNLIGMLTVPVGLFGFALIYSALLAFTRQFHDQALRVFSSGSFWFAMFLAILLCAMPDVAIAFLRRTYRPRLVDIVMEKQYLDRKANLALASEPSEMYAMRGASMESSPGRMASPSTELKLVEADYTGYAFDHPREPDVDISTVPQVLDADELLHRPASVSFPRAPTPRALPRTMTSP